MRISVDLYGEKVVDWKVDCDNYLPDNMQKVDGFKDSEVSYGKERVCVLPKDEYKHFHGVGSWMRSWTGTIAVTE